MDTGVDTVVMDIAKVDSCRVGHCQVDSVHGSLSGHLARDPRMTPTHAAGAGVEGRGREGAGEKRLPVMGPLPP